MPDNTPASPKQFENLANELRRELRRTRDMAHRATVMAGAGLIVGIMIFTLALLGLEGLRDNLKILATLSPEELQEAGLTAAEETGIGMEEVNHLVGNAPTINISEWPGYSGDAVITGE
ncbi:MAG: hypothetical protein R3F46_07485 [bacterium]